MAELALNNITENVCNMSRVNIEQKLEVNCLNGTSTKPSSCDRLAQGISLSTPIIMTTFGVLGNILALIVLYASRREAQARRTVFFVMLSGLAWTDLIGLLAVSPIAIITYANNLSWVGGVPLCRYHGFMMVSFGVVLPLIVCCMSVERFLAIKFAYYYARHITRRKAQLIFLACWAVTASFTTLPFVGFGSYELQYPGSWCFLNFHRESKVDTIYAAMFSSLNIIAIVIMIMCNLVVAGTLFRLRLRRRLHSSPSIDRKLSVSGIGSSTSGTVIRQKHHSDMEAQMIWFLCLITVAFSVCWLPLNVHILIMQFTGTTNLVLDLQFIRMVSCNQILDPWLYVIFRKNSLLRIIRQVKACCCGSKEPVKISLAKPPSMRYIMGNKSFFCEPTTVAKTFGGEHRRNNLPMLCVHSMDNCDEKIKYNNCNGNLGSSTHRLSSCHSCEDACFSEKSSQEISDSLQRLVLSVLQVKDSSCSSLENISDSDTYQHGIQHHETEPSHNESITQCYLQAESQIKSTQPAHNIFLGTQGADKNTAINDPYSSDSIYHMSSTSVHDAYTQQVTLVTPTHNTPLYETVNSPLGAVLPVPVTELRLQPGKQTLDHYLLMSPPLASPELSDTSSQNNSQENLSNYLELGNSSAIPVNIPSSVDSGCALKTKSCYSTSNFVNKCAGSITSFKFSPNTLTSTCRQLSDCENTTNDDPTLPCPKEKTMLKDNPTKNSLYEYSNHKSPSETTDFQEDEPHCLLLPDLLSPVKSLLSPSNNCRQARSDQTYQSPKMSVSDLGAEDNMDASRRLLQGADHADQIKCFKTKNRPFLDRNGIACHHQGIN